MSLETALLSMLQVHAGHPDTSPLSGDDFRRRLGYEQTSGNSVRLLVGLQLYGLVQRSEKDYVLTRAALHLLETADERAFRAGLQRAATLPPLLRELTERYGTDLDGHDLRDDLKGRRLPENERRTLTKVLHDNQELLGQTARVGTLFEQFGKHSPSRQPASQVSAGQWLRTLPGRTANLTLVAVVFVVSLVGAALLPGTQKPVTQVQAVRPPTPAGRQIPAPVAVVSVPLVSTEPTKPGMQASSQGGSSDKPQTVETATTNSRSAGTFSDAPTATSATAPRSASTANPGPSVRTAGTAQASTASPARAATRPQANASGTSSTASERTQTTPAQIAPSREARTRTVQEVSSQAPTSRRQGVATVAAQGQPTGQRTAQSGVTRSTVTAVSSSTLEPNPLASDPLELGRRLAGLLYSQRLTLLWKSFSPSVQQEWGSFAAFRDYRLGGLEAYGAETRVVSEEVRTSGGVTYYVRTATFERGPDHDWTLILGLNPAGQVVEFNIVTAGVLPGVTASAER